MRETLFHTGDMPGISFEWVPTAVYYYHPVMTTSNAPELDVDYFAWANVSLFVGESHLSPGILDEHYSAWLKNLSSSI